MNLIKKLKKSENPKEAITTLLLDPLNPLLAQDKSTNYSLLHALIILTEDDLLSTYLTLLPKHCLKHNLPHL